MLNEAEQKYMNLFEALGIASEVSATLNSFQMYQLYFAARSAIAPEYQAAREETFQEALVELAEKYEPSDLRCRAHIFADANTLPCDVVEEMSEQRRAEVRAAIGY
jgi:hypothetical protein